MKISIFSLRKIDFLVVSGYFMGFDDEFLGASVDFLDKGLDFLSLEFFEALMIKLLGIVVLTLIDSVVFRRWEDL